MNDKIPFAEMLEDGIKKLVDGKAQNVVLCGQLVEVVRCRDCKHSWEDISGRICSYGPCVDCIVLDDFYCSYGERKDGDTDGS